MDCYPIDFGRGESSRVRDVIDRRRQDKFLLRNPRLDAKRLAFAAANRHAVV